MLMPSFKNMAIAATACTALALPAFAETVSYTADLTAAAEVPPADSPATGTADVTVDTEAKTVSWTVTVMDLTGDAVAAHIHGPASEDENAGPVITMSDAIMEGSADISEAQISELADGKYYLNVHTEQYPDGEIRGQLSKAD